MHSGNRSSNASDYSVVVCKRGDLDTGISCVENAVIVLEEHITKDCKVHSGRAKSSDILQSTVSSCLVLHFTVLAWRGSYLALVLFEYQIRGWNLERGTVDGECQVGQVGCVVWKSVCSVAIVSGIELFSKLVGLLLRKEKKSGSSIQNTRERSSRGAACGNVVNGDSPKSLRFVNRNGCQCTTDLGLIVSAKDVLSSSSVLLLAKEHTKNGLADQILRDQIVGWCLNSLDSGNRIKCQTIK